MAFYTIIVSTWFLFKNTHATLRCHEKYPSHSHSPLVVCIKYIFLLVHHRTSMCVCRWVFCNDLFILLVLVNLTPGQNETCQGRNDKMKPKKTKVVKRLNGIVCKLYCQMVTVIWLAHLCIGIALTNKSNIIMVDRCFWLLQKFVLLLIYLISTIFNIFNGTLREVRKKD